MNMTRNRLVYLFVLPLVALLFSSCDDQVTYSEMKEKEREAVNDYVKSEKINVISFEEFIANDSTTDVGRNEYVEVDDVYLQIVNNPKNIPGAYAIEDGDNIDMLIRYYEYNIQDGDTISGNLFSADADEMRVSNKSGSYSATFISGMMKAIYGDYVPTGWLVPLRFLKFVRSQSNLAKVNIIVPHTKGTSTATTYVYPCLYQITFQPSVSVVIPE